VLETIRREFELAMALSGCKLVSEIGPHLLLQLPGAKLQPVAAMDWPMHSQTGCCGGSGCQKSAAAVICCECSNKQGQQQQHQQQGQLSKL